MDRLHGNPDYEHELGQQGPGRAPAPGPQHDYSSAVSVEMHWTGARGFEGRQNRHLRLLRVVEGSARRTIIAFPTETRRRQPGHFGIRAQKGTQWGEVGREGQFGSV